MYKPLIYLLFLLNYSIIAKITCKNNQNPRVDKVLKSI